MDDEFDPGPGTSTRRGATQTRFPRGRGYGRGQRNGRARGNGRGRGNGRDRSNSVQRDHHNGQGRDRNAERVDPRQNFRDDYNHQPQRRGGRAGFPNVDHRLDAEQRNVAPNNARDQHFNQRRGHLNDRNQRHHPYPQSNRRDDNRHYRKKNIGFKRLEEIAQSESQDALAKLIESKEVFLELIESHIERYEIFVLVMECMAKVCQSSFDELKLSLLRDICNSNFIVSLKSYLMDLPYTQAKAANNMYWKNQDAFWKNYVMFLENIINTSPSLALNKCRSLVEGTSVACLDGLKERHAYTLPEEYDSKLKELRERMLNFEKVKETTGSRKPFKPEDGKPPENFRELSVMPTREDLVQRKAFVRPNIVDGAYEDVEHYLDVQFRLLREDCFGPLRHGLYQYIENPKRRKYDHIRVIHNVKFVKPYVSQTKMGSLVQIDIAANKNFRRMNWANNKRFIFGSLVLFTKDNCRSFLVATILDRDVNFLTRGMIPVSLIGSEFNERLYNDDTYTMIESEVYFEPYYHVLNALRDPSFPEHLPMKQYIVDVNPTPRPPKYLDLTTEFVYRLNDYKPRDDDLRRSRSPEYDEESNEESEDEQLHRPDSREDNVEKLKFTVLQDETWHGKDAMQFNHTQLEAYRLSLQQELAVIQGPPGTGKTYLGIKVAKTLFQNLKKDMKGCLMLVICYTNHALDQFLEALLTVTGSIARIGGQSRNEAMKSINLTKLRREESCKHSDAHRVFIDQKISLRSQMAEFQRLVLALDVFLNGVMKCNALLDIPEIGLLCKFYNNPQGRDDALYQWLFENVTDYYMDNIDELLYDENLGSNGYADHEKEARKRTGFQLEEQENNESEQITHRKNISSFSLEETYTLLKEMILKYKDAGYHKEKRKRKKKIQLEIQYLNSRKVLFNDMSEYRERTIVVDISEGTNFYRFSMKDRWTLYFMWIRTKVAEIKENIGELQVRVNTASTAFEEARMLLDMQVLRHKRIVGMTTSGAARMRKLLQTLAPPIVIVEEAAEVLEQHIITSLTKACSHLILIGDHQQLRPSASHMKLAKHYQIEVSLFERMITNGMHSRRLGVQHRMRPEIAALICPHIYADLQNHHSVYDFPDVKGITKNLFFFSHDFKEDVVEENMSRTNHEEADLVLALANYLMQQGYTSDDVTILAAYKGQMFYMRKESDKYNHLKGVKITVVDNYQGEESKIILLSLVRNNEDNRIGFLGTPNRICVALSRAKEGFYIFGNIEILKTNSELWRNIATTLESGDSLGTTIVLKCQNHPDSTTNVTKVADFEEVPEGGCKLQCNFPLRGCGHLCLLFCHGYDREHVTPYTRCPKRCERTLCDLGHGCPKKCGDECGPCKKKMTKTLPCGHEAKIDCYLEPDDLAVKCYTMVEVTLPDCGHKAQKMCHVKIDTVQCPTNCEYRVDECGHCCERKCHVNNDPDHEKYLCRKPCAKANAGCTAGLEGNRGDHQCLKQCHEKCDDCHIKVKKRRSTCAHLEPTTCITNIDLIPCMKKCSKKLKTCDHFCKKKCSEPCGDCQEIVKKVIPDCKHEVKMKCKQVPVRELCTAKCERTMSCGHRCKGVCGQKCDRTLCTEPSSTKVLSPCGHQVTLPCNMSTKTAGDIDSHTLWQLCHVPCGAELACKHLCGGSCWRCRGGALHAPCSQTCNQINICEHQCEEPCNQICPPCKKQCEVRCQHSRCRNICGAPCTPCREPCSRRCKHGGVCRMRCGEVCARPPCDEPCERALPCGHPCRGLCAEPCPPVCRHCDPDNFPRDFLGDEFDDDAKFVLLHDCGHVMEVENMDTMMLGDRDMVTIRKCPFCRKPIINTGRYKDHVNKIFKEEINPIKSKIYGNKQQIEEKKKELVEKLQQFSTKYTKVLLGNIHIKAVYLNLQSIAETTKNVSKLHLDMEVICLNILDMIAECYNKYLEVRTSELKEKIDDQMRRLCKVFTFKLAAGAMLKVSEQQQKDLDCEIKRLNSIVQLAKLTIHPTYVMAKTKPEVRKEYNSASETVFVRAMFEENKAIQALKKLQEAMRVSGVVSKQERDMIVKAMEMKAGHWFKCVNGHFYCIGECGGAMERSKCPDCGAVIGGGQHQLAAGNQHAREVDGSTFPAWSEHNNNMANIDLNFND